MCMIDYADEPFIVHHTNRRRSRIERRCVECSARIAPGDSYQCGRGLYDGHWQTYAQCIACADGPCAWLTAMCGGFLYCGVYEDLQEHWDEEREVIDRADAAELGWHLLRMRHRMAAARVQ